MAQGAMLVPRQLSGRKEAQGPANTRSCTCVSKPVETSGRGLGDLPVGGGCVGAAGIAGRGHDVHLGLAHVEEAYVQLEIAAPTGLSHVGAEHGL